MKELSYALIIAGLVLLQNIGDRHLSLTVNVNPTPQTDAGLHDFVDAPLR